MNIEILGCSGGMGLGQQTTCYRVDEQTLLDAGSGLGQLPQEELLKIRRVFITHSHLDHICFLPLLIDNIFESLHQPLQVYALPEVLAILHEHIFNWEIWPDFSTLPSAKKPAVAFNTIQPWEKVVLGDITFTAFPVEHVVPTCGYHLVSDDGRSLAFTGDTVYSESVVHSLNQLGQLDVLITECALPDRLLEMSQIAKHLTPQRVKALVCSLALKPRQLWLSHLKPSQQREISEELKALEIPGTALKILKPDTRLQL